MRDHLAKTQNFLILISSPIKYDDVHTLICGLTSCFDLLFIVLNVTEIVL